jgi:hypothetical protein
MNDFWPGVGGTDESKGLRTRWNPSGLKTNCGFCAISYALEKQKGILVDADRLYAETLQRLEIQSPLPHMLMFPEPGLDERPIRTGYEGLDGRGRSPADYSLWSVAHDAGLELKSGDRDLLNSLMKFASDKGAGWSLDEFVRKRKTGRTATLDQLKQYVRDSLKGHSIIGSIKGQHFMNLEYNSTTGLKAFDPQIGVACEIPQVKNRLGVLDLFERVTTGGKR